MTEQLHAETQTSTSTTTGVFALLKAKPGVTRERVMAIMPAEIRATVQLYLGGKIREWYAREDGKGAVFLTALGHGGDALRCGGFMTTLQRGAEWAATGAVTQTIPADFPSPDKVSLR